MGYDPIPPGHQIFVNDFGLEEFVADRAFRLLERGDGWLELGRESPSREDGRLIAVISCRKGFLGTKRQFIGWVPNNIAETIIQKNMFEVIKPRFRNLWEGDRDRSNLYMDLTGPKDRYKDFIS